MCRTDPPPGITPPSRVREKNPREVGWHLFPQGGWDRDAETKATTWALRAAAHMAQP